jgi:hypothetical protein
MSLNNLPNEITSGILEYVPFVESHKLLAVSRTWYLLLAALLQKQIETIWEDEIFCPTHFESKNYQVYHWCENPNLPEDYDYGSNYHRIEISHEVNFTIDKGPKMTNKEFRKLSKMNNMKLIEGVIPWFHVELPLYIRSNIKYPEIEAPYEWVNTESYSHGDEYEYFWPSIKKLICSINSVKKKVILKEENDIHENYTCELYFLMRDGTTWNMKLGSEYEDRRYIAYNQ